MARAHAHPYLISLNTRMPTRRNRLRRRKTQRRQRQRQRGGKRRGLRNDVGFQLAGRMDPALFDDLQVAGIRKYEELFSKKETYWRNQQRATSVAFGKPCTHQAIGSQCDGYPGIVCSSTTYLAPQGRGTNQPGEHRCVKRFGPSTYKQSYDGRWYEEDNWYLEPRIVALPEFRADIVAKFKEWSILDDSFDKLSETEQDKLLTAKLEERYGE